MAGFQRLAEQPPRTVLEAEIRRQQLTHRDVIARFAMTASTLGLDITLTDRHLRRLVSGERSSAGPHTCRVLSRLFGRSSDDLFSPPSDLPATTGEVTPSTAAPRRRQTYEELIAVAASRAREFTLSAAAPPAEETMEQLFSDVSNLAVGYQQRPVGEILGGLVETQDSIFTLLEHRPRPVEARQLYLLAGVVGGLLAKVSHDLADPHAASTQARAAYLAAEHADHAGLRAWIRGLQSLIAYWAGRHGEAIRFAQEGQSYRPNGTVSAWLPVSEARAWAALGNEDQARRSITAAEDAWDLISTDEMDELGGLCRFSRTRHTYYAADALAWLPEQTAETATRAEAAVAAYSDRQAEDWAFGDEAGSRTDLAIARLGQRDLEGAREALAPVLSLPVSCRINGIVHSVQNVQRRLVVANLTQDPVAIDLRDQIEDFTRATAAAARR